MGATWAFNELKEKFDNGGLHEWMINFHYFRKFDIEHHKGIFLIQRDQYKYGYIIYMNVLEDYTPIFLIKDFYDEVLFSVRVNKNLSNIGTSFNTSMKIVDELMLEVVYDNHWYNPKNKTKKYLVGIKNRCDDKRNIKVEYKNKVITK